MKITKIEWCDCTINPVIGCKRGCPYCYARRMNNRFNWTPDFSIPQFFSERLKQIKGKKPKSIFMDSMSDIEFWTNKWIEEILCAIHKNPQHNYIFLTKSSALPYNLFYKQTFEDSKNLFFGKTVTINKQIEFTDNYNFDFLSIEPLHGPLNLRIKKKVRLKQIIIGAETGNRKDKIIPKKEWIDSIVKQADEYGVRVFMKDSLIPIVGEENMRRDLVWAIRPKEEL